jgi:RNA polymerase sigma-70 factor (ECF subfamily)
VTADSDPDVIHRILTGQREAYAILMRRYNQRLYRIAWAITRDGAEAEDAVQDSWIRVFEQLSRLSDPSRFGGWLARLTVNQALMRRRRRASREVLLNEEAELPTTLREDPESLALRRELRPLIESAVAALPEAFRIVFVLREVEGMSVAEIGECLNVPEATVKTRAFRARELLRARLAECADPAYPLVLTFAGNRCSGLAGRVLAELDRKIE